MRRKVPTLILPILLVVLSFGALQAESCDSFDRIVQSNFVSFSGSFDLASDQISLDWKVNEISAGSYLIQRSIDGCRFTTLAEISIPKDSPSLSFSYKDDNILVDGYYFYRLKETGTHKKATYSKPISFLVKRVKEEPVVDLVADHANHIISLDIKGTTCDKLEMELYNCKGQIISGVKVDRVQTEEGYTLKFDCSILEGKHYIARLVIGETIHIEQIKLQS